MIVGLWIGFGIQTGVLYVTDDADDLGPLVFIEPRQNALADRIFVRPVQPLSGLIDNDYLGRPFIVGGVEQPAPQQRDAERGEVSAARSPELGARLVRG